MQSVSIRCRRCLRELDPDSKKCLNCGKIVDEIDVKENDDIKTFEIINDRYIIGECIRKNNQCRTYMGYDKQLDSYINIKEYMPISITYRDKNDVIPIENKEELYQKNKRLFIELHKRLKKFRTMSNIEQVYDIFEENNTCYVILEELKGKQLSEYLSGNYGELSWDDANFMFTNLMKAIVNLHNSGIFHLRISPYTLIVTEDKNLKLIDFISREYNEKNELLSCDLIEGYAAIEQYKNEKCGTYTDVYGLASTIYKTLTGTMPIDSKTRLIKDNLLTLYVLNENVPKNVSLAIMSALNISPKLRTQTMDDFYADTITPLRSTQKIVHKINQVEDEYIDKSVPKTKRLVLFSTLISLSTLLLIVIIIMVIIFKDEIFGLV